MTTVAVILLILQVAVIVLMVSILLVDWYGPPEWRKRLHHLKRQVRVPSH